MSLQSSNGVLAQPIVGLPDAAGRFVRLIWLDPATAPTLTGAASVADTPGRVAVAAANELVFAPSAAPAGKEPEPRGSLHFDLGGRLPLIDVDLRFAAGTRVAPVRLQGRTRAEDPWRELGSGVFYRIERDGQATDAPALVLPTHARFIRVVPDERAAALDPAQTRLVVHARLATLVFASSGRAPLRLLAGSVDAPTGALPLTTLVPQFDQERKRFGQARLGAFAEAPEVARAAERAVRKRASAWVCSGRCWCSASPGWACSSGAWRRPAPRPRRPPPEPPGAQAPSSSPTGFSSSTRSQTDLTTIRIGIPSSRPHTPQSQPNRSTPTKTANALIRLARPIHQGVSRLPTSVWMANEAAPM